jgi:predicted short-subunit dehydrogenase-like oxidoreductase (DUF2520 family)
MRTPRIAFIGVGQVAMTLAQAMHRAGFQVAAAFGRNRSRADALARLIPGLQIAVTMQDAADAADYIFLTVSDDAIAGVCESIAWSPRHAAIHCSGATELSALDHAARSGAAVGGFHPLQMFANPAISLETLPGCTVTIDGPSTPAATGEPPLIDVLEEICLAIGCRPMRLPPGKRALYHASANYIGPFVIALIRETVEMWRTFGASEEDTLAALMPLLRGTLAAVDDRGLAGGMGGCVARGDVGTVKRHLVALEQFSPDTASLYRTMTLRTIPLAMERGTLAEENARQIRAIVSQN